MDTASKFLPFSKACSTFQGLSDDLGRMVAPNEAAFIALGDALGAARAKLAAGKEQFGELSARMDHGDGESTAQTLDAAREQVLHVGRQGREIGTALTALVQTKTAIGRPLGALGKIIGEISALATNAKVQAAQVNAAGIDFSVFTKDIDRLRMLAEEAVRRADGRLEHLASIMSTAGEDAAAFQKGEATELEGIAGNLKSRLTELVIRREQAQRALGDFEKRTADIGQRVSSCMVALQVNDLTSQRIGHVQTALGLMCLLAGDAASDQAGLEWVGEMSDERRRSLLAAVCTLQATQLNRAAADFTSSVTDLRRNLSGLACDARAIQAEAQRVFGGEHGNGSFIHAIFNDVSRATNLLRGYCTVDDRIRELIEQVSHGFALMAEDLQAIQSIDADMRIMGLNATLKCTRLGKSGLALGVVAQELRACSRRTEETAKAIASAIAAAARDAATLASKSSAEHAQASHLADEMARSAQSLGGFGDILNHALDSMTAACGDVGNLLDEAARDDVVERSLVEGIAEVASALKDIAGQIGGPVDPALVRDDIHRMLGAHYTMASERAIHELFAENVETETAPPPATDADGQADIDDLFF